MMNNDMRAILMDMMNDKRSGYNGMDGRRGVRGTGTYGMGGRRYYGDRGMDYNDYNDRGRDYRDYERDYGRDYRDYGYDGAEGDLTLTQHDIDEWERTIVNADGTHGFHFDRREIEQACEQMGVKGRNYGVKEAYIVANMLYSDYGNTLKPLIPRDQEPHYYAALAKDFLEDKDGLNGAEKLVAYYYFLVKAQGDERRR